MSFIWPSHGSNQLPLTDCSNDFVIEATENVTNSNFIHFFIDFWFKLTFFLSVYMYMNLFVSYVCIYFINLYCVWEYLWSWDTMSGLENIVLYVCLHNLELVSCAATLSIITWNLDFNYQHKNIVIFSMKSEQLRNWNVSTTYLNVICWCPTRFC